MSKTYEEKLDDLCLHQALNTMFCEDITPEEYYKWLEDDDAESFPDEWVVWEPFQYHSFESLFEILDEFRWAKKNNAEAVIKLYNEAIENKEI